MNLTVFFFIPQGRDSWKINNVLLLLLLLLLLSSLLLLLLLKRFELHESFLLYHVMQD